MKIIIILSLTILSLYGANPGELIEVQIPGTVQVEEINPPLPKEHVFSRPVSPNAFPDNYDEDSKASEASVLEDLPHVGPVHKRVSAPQKDASCCIVL